MKHQEPTTAEPSTRGVLIPDLVLPEDLAAILHEPVDEIRAAILAGEFGPYSSFAGRLILRRESLFHHVMKNEITPKHQRRRPTLVPRREEP